MSDLIHLAARFRVDTESADGWIIATCPLLHVVTQGRSVPEALDRTREEIQGLMEHGFQRGLLHELIQHRFNLSGQSLPSQPSPDTETHWVDIELPIEVIRELSRAA